MQFLEEEGLYESIEESALREEVLGTLDKLVKEWVKRVGRAAELADSFVSDSNAKIFTFGSYRLGVHGPGKVPSVATCWLCCKKVCKLCDGITSHLLCTFMQELILILYVLGLDMSAERQTFSVLSLHACSQCLW